MHHVVRELEYASRVGFRPLLLDLHLPMSEPSGEGWPLILFVHGGGWRLGSRSVFCPTIPTAESFDRLVDAGYAVASIDYRLSGEAHFPAQIEDARDALAWLRENADHLRIDGSRVFGWGESAGATIVALVALEPGSGILGVVDWYGPSNLVSLAERFGQDAAASTRETEWLGVSAFDDVELARSASPVFQVTKWAPPFHIEHGTEDAFVTSEQSDELAAALVEHGVDVTLVPVEGANHMWKDASGIVDRNAIMGRSIAFIDGILETAGQTT